MPILLALFNSKVIPANYKRLMEEEKSSPITLF